MTKKSRYSYTTSWAVGRRFRSHRRIAPMSRRCAGANLAISVRTWASADRRVTADWVLPGTSASTWTERRPEGSFFTLITAPWIRKFWQRVSSRVLRALRLCVEKVVHHRDDDGHALHQRDVGGVGQDGQSRCGARLQVAVDLAALQAKHFRDVLEPHAISVAVDEKHRRLGGLKLVGAEVVPFRSRGEDPLDEIRKVVWSRAQLLVLGFDGRAFEGVRREFRESVERFLYHTVTAERGRNDDRLSHFVRMADRTLHRHGAAHAIADEVRPRDLELLEQRRHIVGEVFVGDVAWDVRRASVALHFDGNHFPRFGELADPPGPVVGDGHERAVEQHHRFAAAVDFVVHFDSVDWGVARCWFLLGRHVSRYEHHQEESCCLHVWRNSFSLKYF